MSFEIVFYFFMNKEVQLIIQIFSSNLLHFDVSLIETEMVLWNGVNSIFPFMAINKIFMFFNNAVF